jgi:hypothetical protein
MEEVVAMTDTVRHNRDESGRFLPGASGNPGGRPQRNPNVLETLKAATPKAAETLVELLTSKNEKLRYQAANSILDRIYGRPEVTGIFNIQAQTWTPAAIMEAIEERRIQQGELPVLELESGE